MIDTMICTLLHCCLFLLCHQFCHFFLSCWRKHKKSSTIERISYKPSWYRWLSLCSIWSRPVKTWDHICFSWFGCFQLFIIYCHRLTSAVTELNNIVNSCPFFCRHSCVDHANAFSVIVFFIYLTLCIFLHWKCLTEIFPHYVCSCSVLPT